MTKQKTTRAVKNIFSNIPKKYNVSIKLPEKIRFACETAAKKEGISLQNWLVKTLYTLTIKK